MSESADQKLIQQLEEELKKVKVSDLLVQTLSTVSSLAYHRLSEEHRLVVACRYFLDLSEAETASVLGIRRGTVKSRLSRALERLREEVPAHD